MNNMVKTTVFDRFPSQNSAFGAFIVILALLAVFRLIAIYFSNTELFFDESQYWAWSKVLDFGYFSKPPMLAWSIRGVTEICGINDFCIRAGSPLFYTVTSMFIFFAARSLYGTAVGFWAALAFVTVPGVSFSAGRISTDVPLLAFWALALWSLVEFQKTKKWSWSVLLGVAIGFGLLSKYAMAFFLLCFVVYLVIEPNARWIVRSPQFWTAIVISGIIVSPNIIWNLQNGLVTFSHTADNANWGAAPSGITEILASLGKKTGKALEFFGAQFGVAGPVFFAALLIILWRFLRSSKTTGSLLTSEDRMLLAFSIPVILIITIQAFLSRAHANWAATAYPAAVILVVAIMMRERAWTALRASFAINIVVLILLAAGTATAGLFPLPFGIAPFSRVLGWQEIAAKAEEKFKSNEFSAILTNNREVSAQTVYFLRDSNIPIYAWKRSAVPGDYYQMVQPYNGQASDKPMLLVSKYRVPSHVKRGFSTVEHVGSAQVPAGKSAVRKIYFFKVSGYKTGQ
ncbi:MAG: ArnT family glycosyltransferase [Methyloligellaceae bacterium]